MQLIKLSKLKSNTGQIEGLPKNPRFIKDDRFKKLVKSIQDDPEMLEMRELLAFPLKDNYVIIGGNMRLKAMKELGYKEAPCKIIPADTPAEKLRAYAIKDNVGFGDDDFDLLANEWDFMELEEWGVELPSISVEESQSSQDSQEEDNREEIVIECEKQDKSELEEFLNIKLKEVSFKVNIK